MLFMLFVPVMLFTLFVLLLGCVFVLFTLFVLLLGYVFVLFMLFVRLKSFRTKNEEVSNCPDDLTLLVT